MVKKKTNKKDVFEELGIERMDVPNKQTAQELVEEVSARPTARERARMIKTAEAGIKRERSEARTEALQRVKRYISKPSRISPPARKLDTKVGAVVRKAVHLLAPKTSMVRRITATSKKKVAGRGRGRPRQTYKTRVLPSGKVVKVPTAIYNKMLSQEKAAIRLAQAQRQAMLQQQAEQIAMTQDPRFQPSAEEAWADSEDMEHESEVQRLKQQQLIQQQMYEQQQVQRPTMIRRAGEMFGKARITLMGGQQPQYPQQYPQRPQLQPLHRPNINMELHRPVNPQVVVTGGKSSMFGGRGNIMDQKNEFNKTNKATIGFGRKTI